MEVGHGRRGVWSSSDPVPPGIRAGKGEWFDVLAHTAGTPEYLFEDDVTAFYKDPDDGQPSPRTPMSLEIHGGVAVPSDWSRLEGRFWVRRPGQ